MIHYTRQLRQGHFRFMELRKFLNELNLPRIIWISEEGTGQLDELNMTALDKWLDLLCHS